MNTDPSVGTPWAFASVLLRRRKLVLACSLSGAVLTGVVILLSPRQYTASASFVPQEPGSIQAGLGQIAAQFGLSAPKPGTTSPQFYADLLSSREILREVIVTEYSAGGAPEFKGNLVAYFRLGSDSGSGAMMLALKALRARLKVTTNRTTGVVGFEVRTRNPELSAQIADRLLALVNDYNLRRRQSQARMERTFVEKRLVEAQGELAAAEDALQRFYVTNRRYTDSPELVARQERLQRQVTMRQQLVLSLTQSFESARIDEVRDTPVLTVVEHPTGFVERMARGTIQKTIIGLLAGGFLGSLLAFLFEYVARSRQGMAGDYQEFESLLRQSGAEVRNIVSRRPR